MRVKCNKQCPWGVHHAWGPTFVIEKDMILNTNDVPDDTNSQDWGAFLLKLLDAGHAVQIPDAKVEDKAEGKKPDDSGKSADETSTSEDNKSDTEGDTEGDGEGGFAVNDGTPGGLRLELEGIALIEMDGPMGSEQKAKAALETLGKERYSVDVDKRKTVDGIIEAIVEAAFKE